MNDKPTLGWREWVDLPDLGLPNIKAKVDTGARTSALHTFFIEPFERDGQAWVRFRVHPSQHKGSKVVECEAPVKDQREVRDSGGHVELRYVIQTTIVVGDHPIVADLTLTDRDSMRFRMLLGRTSLNDNFLVDPAKSYLAGRRSRAERLRRREAITSAPGTGNES